jgi:putative endonuclease
MTALHLLRGKQAESAALHYLKNQGLQLLAQNYRCYHGEIDLIMRDAAVLVFIEVRWRKNSVFGDAIASITPNKVRRICHTAQHYLQNHPHFLEIDSRFDVIGIAPPKKIRWLQDAFTVEYGLSDEQSL